MLPVFHVGEKFESGVVRSCSVGGVVPLRFESVFFPEVSISGVLIPVEVVADVSIVVVAYIIAVIDTAVT